MSYNKETGMYEGYIYIITNTKSHHKYVGQTLQTIEKRWHQHELDSKKYDYPQNQISTEIPIHFKTINHYIGL